MPFILLTSAGIFALVFIIALFYAEIELGGLYILGFIPVLCWYFYIQAIQTELLLVMLCERNGWAFNPSEDKTRIVKFKKLFPDVFDRGESATIDNQIWGTVNTQHANAFWSSYFSYINRQGRSSTTFEKHVLIIELNKKLPTNFTLFRYGIRLYEDVESSHLMLKRDFKTESEAFNKLYKIIAKDDSLNEEKKILSALSPSVQVRLIDLAKKYSIDCIEFKHNCMVILFNKDIWRPKYTNFFRRVIIDERDVLLFNQLIKEITELPAEMIKFLD